MGNYPSPSKDALVITFNKSRLHLVFDKSSFTYGDNPEPKIIVVKLILPNTKEKLGTTFNNQLEINIPQNISKVIEESNSTDFMIEFYGVWDEKKLDDEKSSETKSKIQIIKLIDAVQLYDLKLQPEDFIVQEIENYRREIFDYEYIIKGKKINILIIGGEQSGKSALINTFDYCLNGNKNPCAYVNTCQRNSATMEFQEKKILNWLSLWDSPNIQKPDRNLIKIYNDINLFWYQNPIKEICMNTKIISNQSVNKTKPLKIKCIQLFFCGI